MVWLSEIVTLALLAVLALFVHYIHSQRKELHSLRCEHMGKNAEHEEAPFESYDVVLRVSSLRSFAQTRRLPVHVSATCALEMAAEHRYRIVAVTGLFDKGKTWVVNTLFNKRLPSGKMCTTEGISLAWCPEDRILVVDSAGCQAPISFRDQDADNVTDAQVTESFLFELVSRLAHHLLFVVSDFTWFEQRYVQMLHQKYVLGRKSNELIVVHNLKDTHNVGEAEHLFHSQLKTRYDGVGHMNSLAFVADRSPAIHHVGLCAEGSEAAQKYNPRNLGYIRSRVDASDVLGTRVALAPLFSRHLEEVAPKFFFVEPPFFDALTDEALAQCPDVLEPPLDDKMEVVYDTVLQSPDSIEATSTAASHQTKIVAEFVLKVASNSIVDLKKRGSTSALGEVILYDVSFDPEINVFDEPGGRRIVQVECPGVALEAIEIVEGQRDVQLTITKPKAIDEASVEAVEPIMQQHGTWHRSIAFDHDEQKRYRLNQSATSLKRGVLTLVFEPFTIVPRRHSLSVNATGPPASNVPWSPQGSTPIDKPPASTSSPPQGFAGSTFASPHAASSVVRNPPSVAITRAIDPSSAASLEVADWAEVASSVPGQQADNCEVFTVFSESAASVFGDGVVSTGQEAESAALLAVNCNLGDVARRGTCSENGSHFSCSEHTNPFVSMPVTGGHNVLSSTNGSPVCVSGHADSFSARSVSAGDNAVTSEIGNPSTCSERVNSLDAIPNSGGGNTADSENGRLNLIDARSDPGGDDALEFASARGDDSDDAVSEHRESTSPRCYFIGEEQISPQQAHNASLDSIAASDVSWDRRPQRLLTDRGKFN